MPPLQWEYDKSLKDTPRDLKQSIKPSRKFLAQFIASWPEKRKIFISSDLHKGLTQLCRQGRGLLFLKRLPGDFEHTGRHWNMRFEYGFAMPNIRKSPGSNACQCSSSVSGCVAMTAMQSSGVVYLAKSIVISASIKCAVENGQRRTM